MPQNIASPAVYREPRLNAAAFAFARRSTPTIQYKLRRRHRPMYVHRRAGTPCTGPAGSHDRAPHGMGDDRHDAAYATKSVGNMSPRRPFKH